jgi:hypothetical protein
MDKKNLIIKISTDNNGVINYMLVIKKDGTYEYKKKTDIIREINNNNDYYVDNTLVRVIDNKYIRTVGNDDKSDNLGKLPEIDYNDLTFKLFKISSLSK